MVDSSCIGYLISFVALCMTSWPVHLKNVSVLSEFSGKVNGKQFIFASTTK